MRDLDEPNMSDKTLLVSVEDLINMALGPSGRNVVNFKLIQTILHILARQLRLLEQRVEIRIPDERERKQSVSRDLEDTYDERRHPASSDRHAKASRTTRKEKEKAERAQSKERTKTEKDKEKADRAASKEKYKEAEKENDRAERGKEKTEKGEKAETKEREKTDKERAKSERTADKEDEKYERATSKGTDRVEKERTGLKDKEKPEPVSAKDRDREEREKEEKSKGKSEKITEKNTEKRAKGADEGTKTAGRAKSKERRGKTASETSIIISEVERRKEKVLIVEKGPTTRTDARRDSIEVVSRSQFDLLENLVKDLQRRAGPPPAPSLPDNKKLRGDLARGSASLTDTMQAMQVTARVRAAEQAISRMGDLLTQLAAAGALPKDFTEQIDAVKFEAVEADVTTVSSLATKSRVDTTSRKSVAIQEGSTMKTGENERTRLTSTAISRMSAASSIQPQRMMSRASTASVAGMPGVTHTEMEAALQTMKDELMKNIQGLTSKASSVAENASVIAKNISEKLNIAIALDDRINTLNTLVSDYAEQLCGFDTGITTQLLSFKDQMSQINSDMRSGLAQLDQVNNNAETAAVMELTERYEGLALELDHTLHAHNGLTTLQRQLSNELHSLVECVEMLREQKADRDEVLDGLRDKADNARLAGLLTVIEFSVARSGLEKRLELCYDKFQRQDNVWMTALKDLMNLTEKKAEMTQLLSARENVEQALRDLQDRLEKLATILGEPKAAMLTRALARDATCGACQVPALMEPTDAVFGAPPPLPALRPQPLGAILEPCLAEWKPPPLPDNREHICHRWCGGSHTLLAPVTHEQAPPIESTRAPTKRYTGYGSDGRLYMMEEDLQPCAECNQFPEKSPEDISPELGAGDQGEKITIE